MDEVKGTFAGCRGLKIKRYPNKFSALRIVAIFPNYEFPGEREEPIAILSDELIPDA